MAGVIGGEAGYATVAPTRNYIGEAMLNVQDSMFRQNAQRIADERTKIEAERTIIEDRRRDFADAQEFAKQNPFIATGTGLDASNRQSYMNAKNIASEARENFMKTGDQKYNAIYENAISSVNHLSEMPNKLNALKEDWVKNVANYNPQSLLKKGELIDKLGNGDIVQTNDVNGNPRYSIFDRDAEGNLSKVAYKEISGQQLLQLLKPVENFNIDGSDGEKGTSLVKTFNDNIGKERKIIVGTGLNAKEKTFNPGAEELAKVMAEEVVQDKSKLYKVFTKLGLDPENEANYTNPKNIEAAKQFIEKRLIATAQTTISDKPDTSLAQLELSQQGKSETARHNKAVEAKEGTTTTTTSQAVNSITGKPMVDAQGNPVMVTKVSVTKPNTTTPNSKTAQNTKATVPTYSVKDLKANGWNDAQIKQAVKEGKIKTK